MYTKTLNKNKQVASISGGRTSHYMISLLLDTYGKEGVDFVVCDTGAEHEGTYKFIRDTEKTFGISITCLRLHLPKEKGVGAQYKIVDIEELKKDYKPFRELMEKYGRPFNPGGKFCTDQMKTQIYRKYCKDVYGKGGYTTWIGYRADPKDSSRAWGHTLSGTLSKWFSTPQREQGDFYKTCTEMLDKGVDYLLELIFENYTPSVEDITKYLEVKEQLVEVSKEHPEALMKTIKSVIKDINDLKKSEGFSDEDHLVRVLKIAARVIQNLDLGYRFLFEISDFEKEDILDWWKEQEFDLDIPNHCGNCMFCIEKTVNQLSYLCHTQKEEANIWRVELNNPNIPIKGRKMDETFMYRDGKRKLSFDQLYKEAMEHSEDYWLAKVGMEKRLSPCAGGSCDLYGNDLEEL